MDFAINSRPPAGAHLIETIDMHTGGEPLRVLYAGMPDLPGQTILERRQAALRQHDFLRQALMWEPRGHADMYGAWLMPPERPDSDFGVLFLHNEGYSTMCGHAIIALAILAAESGWVPVGAREATVKIDTPAGQIIAWATRSGPEQPFRQAHFQNVPSFAPALDQQLDVGEGLRVQYDLAYGGAFYAYVDAGPLGLSLLPSETARLISLGMQIKQAVAAQTQALYHPEAADLGFLYGTIFTGTAHSPAHHSRHVCIFAEGEVDRSPTGTGVSARLALLAAKNQLLPHQEIIIESILGSTFAGQYQPTEPVASHAAVIPTVSGTAWMTGRHTFWLEADDPLRNGFLLR